MSTRTIYDVDTREPAACVSSCVALETFRATTVVCRPISEGTEGAGL